MAATVSRLPFRRKNHGGDGTNDGPALRQAPLGIAMTPLPIFVVAGTLAATVVFALVVDTAKGLCSGDSESPDRRTLAALAARAAPQLTARHATAAPASSANSLPPRIRRSTLIVSVR
jgi:magnesium-transporting ATPase (P-type)